MKKVALYIISDGIGGAEQVVWQTLKQLRGKAEVFLIVNNEIAWYYEKVIDKERIMNIGFVYPHLNRKCSYVRYALNNRYYSVKPFLVRSKTYGILKFIRDRNIEIVHAHLEYALFSSIRLKRKSFGLKLCYTVHSAFGIKDETNYSHQIRIDKEDFTKIDLVVFVSQYVQRLYLENHFPLNKYSVVVNGFSSNSVNIKRNKVELEKNIILYVGGEKGVKGYDLLVQTVSLLVYKYQFDDIVVWVLGNVKTDGLFKKMVKENHLEEKFKFIGFVKPPKHLEYFQNASILFMPSRTEAMPMAAIEAVFCDLPIIATDIGGIPEIVSSQHNGYCSTLDPSTFAYNIQMVLNSYDTFIKKTMVFNTQLKVKFKLESMCNKLLEIYGSL